MTNRERLDGPGMILGDRLSKRLIDFLHRLETGLQTTTATAEGAAESAEAAEAAPPISITGSGVTGSAEDGYVITAPAAAGSVPLSIDEDAIYTVATNTQVLYSIPIVIDGLLVIDGHLVQV